MLYGPRMLMLVIVLLELAGQPVCSARQTDVLHMLLVLRIPFQIATARSQRRSQVGALVWRRFVA